MEQPKALLDVLAQVPDPRGSHGLRHPLSAVLGLTVVAVFAGARSPESIAQFGRDDGPELTHLLGFRRRTPCKATLSNLFRVLDFEAFEMRLAAWIASRLAAWIASRLAVDRDAEATCGPLVPDCQQRRQGTRPTRTPHADQHGRTDRLAGPGRVVAGPGRVA